MESCHHLSNIRPKGNSSILNPQKWMCYVCGTTESVWSCLSCPNVACGRFNEEHALKHFNESKHALCIEVNSKYVYCYLCDDYVMNDNSSGDLKLIRSALSAIATQSFNDVETRGRTLLRSYSHTAVTSTYTSKEDDKIATADWHWRQKLVGKVFSAWHAYMLEARNEKTPKKQGKQTAKVTPPSTSPYLRKRTLIPGITGLRNLGNTCYMNSILQILSNLECFRDYFMKKLETTPTVNSNSQVTTQSSSKPKPPSSELLSTPVTSSGQRTRSRMSQSPITTPHLSRQTTVECFQHLMTPSRSRSSRKGEGLSGGSSTDLAPIRRQLICNVESRDQPGEKISLCQELNGLFRVLWSGRWAQVSPHALLQAVWQAIPTFKGYAQHDAQEFLCELLDKVQAELGSSDTGPSTDISTDTFQGWLTSQVTCLKCGNVSETKESFMDLSLEFPERYQITKQNSNVAQEMCHVTEMLAKFTDTEKLEGKIYGCEKCNEARKNKTTKIYTEAQKRIVIRSLPATLRLHLKRFRWSGRLHREKISTHVAFDEVMDISPFCDLDHPDPKGYEYRLQGVVIHHGKGFGCGHYTAKCWNVEGESWIDCNDARMTLCQLQDVLQSQAYILFYTKVPKTEDVGDSQTLTDCSQSTEDNSQTDCSQSTEDYSQTDCSQSTEDYNMKEDSPPPLKPFDSSQIIDGEITFNFRTPPVLSRMQQGKRSSDSSSDVTERIIKRRRSTLW